VLIRVFASNVLSFDKEVEFSLIPAKSNIRGSHVDRVDSRDDIPVLKTAILYGANASGKSNLIKLMKLLQCIATRSPKTNKEIPYEPFKLGKKVGGTSKIEVEIKIGKFCYAYGVRFNRKLIKEEWLYKINKRSEKKIFVRKSTLKGTTVDLDSVNFKNKEDNQFALFVGKGTPLNQSFLKESKSRNLNSIDEINSVFNWFDEKLNIFFPKTRFRGMEFHFDKENELSKSITEFMSYFGTGVSGMKKRLINPGSSKLKIPSKILDEFIDEIDDGNKGVIASDNNKYSFAVEKSKNGEVKLFKLVTTHLNSNGIEVEFEISEESDGTRRLIDFIPILVDLKKTDAVYLIDEIDRSLHPILSKGIMEYFLDNLSSRQSQLIVTTHESNLLDLNTFRKDEIWFVEKKDGGASSFYSLNDFKPRNDIDIKKGYLNGRYGAIPFLSNTKELNW